MVSGAQGRWLEVRARPREEQPLDDREPGLEESPADQLAAALIELGGRAIEERDGWLVTHLVEPKDADARVAGIEAGIEAGLAARLSAALGFPVVIAIDWREIEDWAETWKRGLAPRRITPRLWVTPSWESAPAAPGEIVIVVDPGMAFGTAEHGTTRGVLRLLDRALRPGERVLDVGSGSAILAVAAARMGAREVVAVEGDPVAGEYARENLTRNGVADRVRWIEAWADPDLLRSLGPAQGVVANIESGVLRRLLPGLRQALAPGGWLILSGVTADEWDPFAGEVAGAGFESVDTDADGEWRAGWFSISRRA